MITEYLREFLGVVGGGTFAATRDANNAATGHRVTGVTVGESGETITLYVLERFMFKLQDNVADNGRIAFCAAAEPDRGYESYQFKGTCTSVEDPSEASAIVVGGWFRRMASEMSEQGYPQQQVQAMRDYPFLEAYAVTFKVEEIFGQTPGPGAGERHQENR